MSLTESHALRHEIVRQVGRVKGGVNGRAHFIRVDGECAQDGLHDQDGLVSLFQGVKKRLFILLEVTDIGRGNTLCPKNPSLGHEQLIIA